MPRKLAKFTFTLTTLTALLASCTHENTKVTLPYKIKGQKDFITLTSEESLTSLLNDESEFNLLLVSYALPSCACWVTFKNDVLLPFITKTEVPVYVIHTDYLSKYYGLPINSTKTNTPVFGIYEEGTYKVGKNYFDEESLFTVYSNFYRYVTSYVNLPTNYK